MTSAEMEESTETYKFNPSLSLYIPIIEDNINEQTIKAIFEYENLGTISRVDFVYNNFGKKQAFIHFREWFNNPKVVSFQEKVLNSKEKARLNYNTNPSKYWPVYPNTKPLAERPSHLNIIDVLQEKIASLEHKLSEISFQYSDQEEVACKRPRNQSSSLLGSVNLVLPSNTETFGVQH